MRSLLEASILTPVSLTPGYDLGLPMSNSSEYLPNLLIADLVERRIHEDNINWLPQLQLDLQHLLLPSAARLQLRLQ